MKHELLRYEMRALRRYFFPLWGIAAVLTIGGYFLTYRFGSTISLPLSLTTLILLFLIFPIPWMMRYYQGLYGDEAYFIHTVPCTTRQLLKSKLHAGVLFLLFHFLMISIFVALTLASNFIFGLGAKIDFTFSHELGEALSTIGYNLTLENWAFIAIGIVWFVLGYLFSFVYAPAFMVTIAHRFFNARFIVLGIFVTTLLTSALYLSLSVLLMKVLPYAFFLHFNPDYTFDIFIQPFQFIDFLTSGTYYDAQNIVLTTVGDLFLLLISWIVLYAVTLYLLKKYRHLR